MTDLIVTLIENAHRKINDKKHDGGWFAASPEAVLALAAERDEARLRLGMLAETVGDFHTAITCTDSDLVIPDMLAAMNDEQQIARAFLARIEGTAPTMNAFDNGEVRATVLAVQGGSQQDPFMGVRRLTPVECERLQGFPDDWTAPLPDSVRYRQLGNAVAVPVAEWIGRRLLEAS